MLSLDNMFRRENKGVFGTSGISLSTLRSHAFNSATLCAFVVCFLVAGISPSSARTRANQSLRGQDKNEVGAQQFVGNWVLTVGEVNDLKDAPLPAPFRDLPKGLSRDLVLVEVLITSNAGTLTGKRILYHYGANSSDSPEKGEVELVNIRAQANVLFGDVTSPEGEHLPGSWEMKLTGAKEVEVRVTGNDVPQEQKQLVLKLHRVQSAN